mgnify:CR=1 FL=1
MSDMDCSKYIKNVKISILFLLLTVVILGLKDVLSEFISSILFIVCLVVFYINFSPYFKCIFEYNKKYKPPFKK